MKIFPTSTWETCDNFPASFYMHKGNSFSLFEFLFSDKMRVKEEGRGNIVEKRGNLQHWNIYAFMCSYVWDIIQG